MGGNLGSTQDTIFFFTGQPFFSELLTPNHRDHFSFSEISVFIDVIVMAMLLKNDLRYEKIFVSGFLGGRGGL